MAPDSVNIRRAWMLLVLLMAAVWFGNLEYRKLVRPDEGRYAEIAREMATSGDWVTPRLNDIKYFEKPALQYWITAGAYRLFGEHHWTARLWSALTGFLGIFFTAFAASRLFGREAGLLSAAVLGSSLLYTLIAHMNSLDMGMTFFMGGALMSFLLAQQDAASAGSNRLWMHVAWAALAFSVLSKGLMGIVLPGAVIVLYTLIERDFGLWKKLHLFSGIALFMAIAAPWFIAVSIANPEFFHFFFIHEHFERFLTKIHGRYEPWWWFIPVLVAGILPWLITLIDAMAHAWKVDESSPLPNPLPLAGEGAEVSLRDVRTNRFKPKRFLLIWAVFIFVFFSLSGSKLASYILPIFPALALLIGDHLSRIDGRRLFWQMLPVAFLAAAGLVLAPNAVRFADNELARGQYAQFANWLLAASAIWLAGTVVALLLSCRDKVRAAIIVLACTSLIAAQILLTGHDSLSATRSDYAIAEQIKPHLRPGAPFYSLEGYDQTLTFYLKRTVTLVAYQDEMAFGIAQEPHKWLPTIESFKQAWVGQPYALAIMPHATYQQLSQQRLPMRVIARSVDKIVVRTP
ncbi:glycosyl transferase family 39 [Sulfuricella sp. T08]|uniref:glycosyltransferase family 39 protein n=1 Tax=Sulfuricella sp. T08 TaxID=1632857 RepID=UPI00061796D4|nr:glycosyltransferase family 39 protein [Sulfuricella sp. T08]GAO35491.1 glycosyl transferase family 39 [Sulfuricella sp. T08]